jgi:hypothetical protein
MQPVLTQKSVTNTFGFLKAENLIHFLKDVQQPIQLIQFQLIIIKQVRPTDKMIEYNKNKYSRKKLFKSCNSRY